MLAKNNRLIVWCELVMFLIKINYVMHAFKLSIPCVINRNWKNEQLALVLTLGQGDVKTHSISVYVMKSMSSQFISNMLDLFIWAYYFHRLCVLNTMNFNNGTTWYLMHIHVMSRRWGLQNWTRSRCLMCFKIKIYQTFCEAHRKNVACST